MTSERSGSEDVVPRAVIHGAFGLLAVLQRLGSARVSELQRESGLPRTTVHRLLNQLEEVGAVERSAGRWRLGPALVDLGADVPAEPRLRSLAQRPLMDLANATGELVALSVELAGQGLVIDVLPGTRPLAREPSVGMALEAAKLAAVGLEAGKVAAVRAHDGRTAEICDLIIDAGGVDPRVSCVAAPIRLTPRDVAAVWLMVPGGAGVPTHAVAATRRAAGRIASLLSMAQPR